MAFNWQTFRTRALTALVFVVVMLTGLLWNYWSFLLLFSVIHFGCWYEYLKLTEKIHQTTFHRYMQLGFMLIGYGIMIMFCGYAYRISGYGLKENIALPVSLAGFILLAIGIFQKQKINLKAFGYAALGLLYISLSWGLMMYLRQKGMHKFDFGRVFPCLIIFSIWINDTMAYIVGSFIGKTPLSKISPKKTWEGTVGGAVLAILVMALLGPLLIGRTSIQIAIIAAISAIAGTYGDLLESKLKRLAGVKDSGSLMPGHGGFLDRFDSLLLATPFVWLYVFLFL